MHRQVLIAAALLLSACEDKPAGRKLASGIAQRIVAGPNAVAFLMDVAHPDDRAVPDDLMAGDLYVARGDEAARKVGSGVATTPGMYAFSKSGKLAFLSAWRFRSGQGELWVDDHQLAQDATSFAWSGDALAFVAAGRLGLWHGGNALTVPIEGVHALLWSPDGKHVAARTASTSGGKLWLVDAATGAKQEVLAGTSDFDFAPDGTLAALGPPPAKGGDRPLMVAGKQLAKATSFAFSPDGKELALLSTDKQPGEATGDLSRIPRGGGTPQPLGQRVSDWRYAPDGSLVFLARYDLRARAGALTVAAPGQPPRELAPKAQSFVLEGKRLLWLVPAPKKGDFKIELWEAPLAGGAEPRKIDDGVYGWQVTPDGKTLFFKARCAGGPRSCVLFRQPLDGGAAELLATNIAGFDLSRDGSRVLLEQPHHGAPRSVDLAVISASAAPPKDLKLFAQDVDPSSQFLDDAGKRVVYAIISAGKGGVYVADVPSP